MMSKKKEINADEVTMLASFGCPIIDIAKYCQCAESTIRKNYKAEFESGLEGLKLNLRKNLIKMSLELQNTSASIFLAKNFLGMSDKTAVDLTGNLETILKECGFEDNPHDQTGTEQAEAFQALGLSTDPTTGGRT